MARPLPYVIWPRDLCSPVEWNYGFDPQSTGGEQLSLSGRLHTASAGRGIWRPTLTTVVHKSRNYAAWRGLGAQIGGRDVPVLVPYYPAFGPWLSEQNSTSFSDGSTFSGSSEFNGFRSRLTIAKAAGAGEVFVTLNKTYAGDVLSGHAFSVNGRLYEVRFVHDQTDDVALIEVQPELRFDVSVGDIADFDEPNVFSRLVNPQAFSQSVGTLFDGAFSISFIEDTAPIIQ